MEPQPTATRAPLQVRIADDIRMKIEAGELAPGAPIPTLDDLRKHWECSLNPARSAIALLKQQGLIVGGRGKPARVRIPPRQVIRSSDRHQTEKSLVLATGTERRTTGLAEMDIGVDLNQLQVRCDYVPVPAEPRLAEIFRITTGDTLLRRAWEHVEPRNDRREAWSVSYIPVSLIESNPAIADPANDPWPGGTQHQLYTVGIEVDRVVDEVAAIMPTTVDAERWELDTGVPLLRCRRISIDTLGRVVEVSDADYPADRTKLVFTTRLAPWSTSATDRK